MEQPKEQKATLAYTSSMTIGWTDCPHCGKLIMFAPKEDMKILKKWRNKK